MQSTLTQRIFITAFCLFLMLSSSHLFVAQAEVRKELTLETQVEKIEAQVLTDRTSAELASMVARRVELDLRVANQASTREWRNIHTKDQWETFRNQRLAALQASLGEFPAE